MFAVFSEKHLCVLTFMFHIVLGAVGGMVNLVKYACQDSEDMGAAQFVAL